MSKINSVKNYWNNQPCNINFSKKKFLSKEYFNEISKKKYFVESHIRQFANFKKYKGKKVLEIGCGIGTAGIDFIKNGAAYTGVDLSKKSLDIFKERIKVFKLEKKKIKLIEASVENLSSVPKCKYDLIYSFGVIHHTPNMKKAFNEIYKLAEKNTIIKIMLYAKNSYKNYMLKVSNYRYEAQKGCPVVFTIDENDLRNLTFGKFKISNVYQDFIFPYKIKPYKKNIYEKIPHFQHMPKNIFKILSKKLGEHMMITLKKI